MESQEEIGRATKMPFLPSNEQWKLSHYLK